MTRGRKPVTVAAYTHQAPAAQIVPAGNLFTAGEPRDYFVSIKRDSRHGLLAGPFATHVEALGWVDRASAEAERVDPWSVFDAFGTCSLPVGSGRVGCLNGRLGLTV